LRRRTVEGVRNACAVTASAWGVVDGDPRGAAVHRVLLGAEALQDFPTLLHFALPLLFAEGKHS